MTGARPADIVRAPADQVEASGQADAFPNNGAFDVVKAAEIERRQRQRFAGIFGVKLFADPARDILLDLFVAEAAGETVSVSGACAASGAPAATALRYMTELERAGLIQRHDDDNDGAGRRDARIELTMRASISMHAYFVANQPPAVPPEMGLW